MNFTFIRALWCYQKYICTGVFIAVFLSACGYRFAGSGNLPGGIQTIAVDIFTNRTSETGLQNIVTNDLIYEFTRKGRTVYTNPKEGGAVLTGVIESSRVSTISRQGQQSPLERRVEITVNLKLTSSDDKVIWSASGISEFEEYDVATDKQATEINKRRAIESLSKRLAEKVYNRMTEDF
jgi:outer membrane lipopolysaccharide assembly protein LptE/RlpB